MAKRSLVASHRQLHGQILLARALFCVGCELIFTGTARCPRCTSVNTVWPLSEWVRSIQPSSAVTVRFPSPLDESPSSTQEQHQPAA